HVLSLLLVTAADDHAAGAFGFARAQTLGVLPPRAHRVATRRRLALAATVRVIDRVHRHAAHRRADALPARAAGLADALELMLFVADFTDGGAAIDVHLAHLAGTQTQLRIAAFAGEQLYARARGARQLRTLARLHFDAVDGRADRDVAQRQGVADLDRRFRTADEFHARRHALGRDDVATLAVHVAQQRQVRAAVRVVLDTLDLGRHAVLVATEIDLAIVLLVTAADVAR